MANFSSGNTQKRREEIKYNGMKFQDFLNDLINERNLFKQDIANLTKNSRKSITEWTTGLSIPSPANFQNILNVLAPTTSVEERNKYIAKQRALRKETSISQRTRTFTIQSARNTSMRKNF